MKAVHLQTEGVSDGHDAALVELSVRLADGVNDVASVRSIGLLSVLYDENATDPWRIMRAVRAAGFQVHPYKHPQTLALAS